MSNSPEVSGVPDGEVQLRLIAGTGDTGTNNHNCEQVVIGEEQVDAPCCGDQNYRRLAICSILCGLSCIGINALIYSVKAQTASDPAAAAQFSRRAKKFGIISIVTWVSILALTPILMALISYLLTLRD